MTENTCYTYFKITGNFNPDIATKRLGLIPNKTWKIGDKRRNGTLFDFCHATRTEIDIDLYVMDLVTLLLLTFTSILFRLVTHSQEKDLLRQVFFVLLN